MKKYNSIKSLVIEETRKLKGKFPERKYLEDLITVNFPNSKWKDTHHAWYKSQIKRGLIDIGLDNSLEAEIDDNNDNYTKEFSLSIEKDLQSYLSLNLNEIEEGLELVSKGIEYKTSAGFIDLLARDKNNNLVVIELKAGKAKDSVIGQILGYIGALSEKTKETNIRGIIIASDFEKRLTYVSNTVNNLSLIKYNLNFNFDSL